MLPSVTSLPASLMLSELVCVCVCVCVGVCVHVHACVGVCLVCISTMGSSCDLYAGKCLATLSSSMVLLR